MSKEPIIETERLILRPITLDDAEACFNDRLFAHDQSLPC